MDNIFDVNTECIFQQKLRELERLVDLIPGAVILQRVPDFRIEYLSPWGMNILGVGPEDVVHLRLKEYIDRYFNPHDAADYIPKVWELIEKGDENAVVTFFQQVRPKNSLEWSWYLSAIKIFMKDPKGYPAYLITIANPIDPLQHITTKVNRILTENNYLRQYNQVFATLTKREKEVLKLMAQSKNALEISEMLFISEFTVETHRKNIRKKINAKSQYDVILFAQAFNII